VVLVKGGLFQMSLIWYSMLIGVWWWDVTPSYCVESLCADGVKKVLYYTSRCMAIWVRLQILRDVLGHRNKETKTKSQGS